MRKFIITTILGLSMAWPLALRSEPVPTDSKYIHIVNQDWSDCYVDVRGEFSYTKTPRIPPGDAAWTITAAKLLLTKGAGYKDAKIVDVRANIKAEFKAQPPPQPPCGLWQSDGSNPGVPIVIPAGQYTQSVDLTPLPQDELFNYPFDGIRYYAFAGGIGPYSPKAVWVQTPLQEDGVQ